MSRAAGRLRRATLRIFLPENLVPAERLELTT